MNQDISSLVLDKSDYVWTKRFMVLLLQTILRVVVVHKATHHYGLELCPQEANWEIVGVQEIPSEAFEWLEGGEVSELLEDPHNSHHPHQAHNVTCLTQNITILRWRRRCCWWTICTITSVVLRRLIAFGCLRPGTDTKSNTRTLQPICLETLYFSFDLILDLR